jgi:hypothetical protein
MSRDVDHDVDVYDYYDETRQYYVTGDYVLILTVHTPEGEQFDLPGTYSHVTDAETFINEHNDEFVGKQREEEREREQEEYEREQEEERERELEEEEHRERIQVWT